MKLQNQHKKGNKTSKIKIHHKIYTLMSNIIEM